MLMHFLSTRILSFLPSHLSVWSQSVYKKLCKTRQREYYWFLCGQHRLGFHLFFDCSTAKLGFTSHHQICYSMLTSRSHIHHPLVFWFLKGIYETPKPQPKYKAIWDVAVVLKHLKTLEPLEELHLKDLTLKLLLLLLLATGQSGQTIYLLNLDGMTMSSQTCHFELLEHIKTSKPSKKRNSIIIHSYRADNTLCPLLTLKEYLKRAVPLRGTELHTTT